MLIGFNRGVNVALLPRLNDFVGFGERENDFDTHGDPSDDSGSLLGELELAFKVFRLTRVVGELDNREARFLCSSSFCSYFSSIIFHFWLEVMLPPSSDTL